MAASKAKEIEVPPVLKEYEEGSNAELILFQCKEMYVYKIPPRKSNLSYRADEWNINKWAWEGALKVISKGDQCFVRLEDTKTGELFAQAPVRKDTPIPVEPVIDSSRFFVLRVEDSTAGHTHTRHAFIGIGFRERPEAYDFQAAVFDHLKYLNRKQEAEEVAEAYGQRPAQDMSLKPGEKLHLEIPKAGPKKEGSLFKNLEGDFVQGLLLKPPPRAADLVRRPSLPEGENGGVGATRSVDQGGRGMGSARVTQERQSKGGEGGDGDDDFGDFQAAS